MYFRRSIAVAAIMMLGSPIVAQETTAKTVVATVNGTDITVGHMIAARDRLPDEYQQIPDAQLFSGLLDQLVQQEALMKGAGELSQRSALTLDNERRSLKVGEIIRAAVSEAVTEEAIQAAYAATYADAQPEQEYNAAHILVETEEEANALVEELNGGADFATLAQERSTGPSGPNGGDLGWFAEGMMVPEFETAVVTLAEGEISEPIQTQFGWHVIKLNEVRQKDAPDLESVRLELVQGIHMETVERVLAEATEEAEITRVTEEEIDPAVLSDTSLLGD